VMASKASSKPLLTAAAARRVRVRRRVLLLMVPLWAGLYFDVGVGESEASSVCGFLCERDRHYMLNC
jgi:hypothetical protein